MGCVTCNAADKKVAFESRIKGRRQDKAIGHDARHLKKSRTMPMMNKLTKRQSLAKETVVVTHSSIRPRAIAEGRRGLEVGPCFLIADSKMRIRS